MKATIELSSLGYAVRIAAIALTVVAAPCAPAATVWNGPLITYNQPTPDPTLEANQDRLTANVWLTRAFRLPMFNAKTEGAYNYTNSPTDTEWAFGNLADYASLTYQTWPVLIGGGGTGRTPLAMVGTNMVLHLISDDIYLSIKFSYWASFSIGGYTYQRSTPGDSGSPAPIVAISSPATGAVFAAPANVRIVADATVDGGSVTNVAFFADNIPLGSVQSPAFTMTASNLAEGAHSLTAVATAGGVTATSSSLNITVVSPVAVSLTSPTVINNQFTFSYSANPGLSYVIQNSSNLLDWVSIQTNVAASNPAVYSDSFSPNGSRYYRVGRLPNP